MMQNSSKTCTLYSFVGVVACLSLVLLSTSACPIVGAETNEADALRLFPNGGTLDLANVREGTLFIQTIDRYEEPVEGVPIVFTSADPQDVVLVNDTSTVSLLAIESSRTTLGNLVFPGGAFVVVRVISTATTGRAALLASSVAASSETVLVGTFSITWSSL